MEIWAMCAVGAGLDTLELIRDEVPVRGVIGLGGSVESDQVSGYMSVEDWCSTRDLETANVSDYALRGAGDRDRLLELEIDLLLVLGWQRLVPGWLIEHARHGAIGAHGSAWGINGGRGRSPQNWAIILGLPEFHLSIFRLDEDADSGAVLDTRTFTYGDRDDIASSYAKASWLQAEMLRDAWLGGTLLDGPAQPQDREARYLPHRRPEDGAIDWNRPVAEVDRFIRALTRPYPGAHVDVGSGTWTIWRATPFEISTSGDASPGEVLHVFADGRALVRCADHALLVEDATPDARRPKAGTTLRSTSFQAQMRGIVARHAEQHPDQPLVDEIASFA